MSSDVTQQGGQQEQGKRVPNIPPYTVELSDLKNSGLITLDTLRLRLRPTWIKSNFFRRTADGQRLSADLGDMVRMPDIPGIQITIDPRAKKYKLYDPLTDNKPLFEEIKSVLSGSDDYVTMRVVGAEISKPMPTVNETIDDDELKTLMLEIARKVHAPEDIRTMVAINGSRVPTEKDLEDYPGEELYDPWNSSPDKPRYVKDVREWRRKLNAQSAMA